MDASGLTAPHEPDEQAKPQEESRVQPANDGPVEQNEEAVFSEDAAQIPEERLLRNDQGAQGQAES